MLNSKLLVILILITAYSCSSGYRIPESMEEKMARFQSRNQNINLVPEFKILPFKRLSNRSPASNENRDFTRGYSNKRLYFLTLYTQYNQLLSFAKNKAPRIKICPGFNTSVQKDIEQFPPFTEHKNRIISLFSPSGKLYSDQQKARNPELSLPVVKNDISPTVADIATKSTAARVKILQKALDIHITKAFSELSELCETGSSPNYYTFENLYSHIQTSGKFKPTPKNLKILYRITLFTNQSLLSSLKRYSKGRSIASIAPRQIYINELVSRFEATWFQNYLHNISKK